MATVRGYAPPLAWRESRKPCSVHSTEVDVYNETARPIVDKVLMGYNGTILAYGQTGTGKTFTMAGICSEPELKGIIPNSFAHIFGYIAKADDHRKYVRTWPSRVNRFLVRVAHIEIYNEEVRDLLGKDQSARLEVKERPDIGVYIKDLSGYVVNNADDMERIMTLGNKNMCEHWSLVVTNVYIPSVRTLVLSCNQCLHPQCANIGPADYNYDETISTLRYANRAKNIKNRARVNEDPKDALLRQFQSEIQELRKQLDDAGLPPHVNGDTAERESESSDDGSSDSETQKGKKKKPLSINKHLMTMDQLNDAEDTVDEYKENKEAEEVDEEKELKEMEDKEKHEVELKKTQTEHEELREKLSNLEKKILVGGENLLEKAQLQEQLLEASARELEQRKKREEQLRQELQQKEAELVDIEERYSSLQEEAIGKTKKLKKVFGLLMSAKAELADLQHEHQREMEGLLDSVRSLTRELKLQEMIIDSFIPLHYQDKLEQYMHWNEDIGEWQLKCVAYTGNNMRKQLPVHSASHGKEYQPPDMSHVYLTYSSDRAATARASRKGKSAGQGPRPSSYR
uniref:Kinesin motor domain-containing protein n=1 Tax=Timema monikensis TaxID=170555 RepID=A0A7R9HP11_9NEOP|nr:unnamed protein product [Timema monikensis]